MAKKKGDNSELTATDVKMTGELEKPVATAEPSPAESQKSSSVKGKKSAAKKSDKPNIFQRMGKGIKGVVSELKKVTWPKGKDVAKSTAVVVVVVVAFFVILFGVDYVLTGLYGLVTSGDWTRLFS